MRAAQAGDAEAFAALYERYVDRLYRYIYYRVGNRTEAEDLTEQVFLKAWEAIRRYEERGVPFGAWLFRLAHNLVIDHYRTTRPTQSLEATGGPTPADPDRLLSLRLELADLQQALARLPEEQQAVIILRFLEGLSHQEVARLLGKSEGAVRVIQHRALAALARLLGGVRNRGNIEAH